MSGALREKWNQLWRATAGEGDLSLWYERLQAAYAESHRQYHTLCHLAECLDEFAGASDLARQPAAVEMALWFHDAVYDPKASDNEEQSAALARTALTPTQASSSFVETVHRLILATKTHDGTIDVDAPLLVDVDLSILGKPVARFQQYEAQIRQEYSWVPQLFFRRKRREILQGFLARDRIYTTSFFALKYEEQARANLEQSLRDLA